MTKNKAGQGLPGLLLFSVLKVARMLCTVWDLFVHRNFRQGGGGVIGFPILFLAMIDQVKTIKLRSIKHLNGISKAHKIICQVFYLQNSP